MQPFVFGKDKDRNADELRRFEGACSKPKGLDAEYAERLDFYLHRQHVHVEKLIRERYKQTWADILPHMETLRLTRFFVDEQAKVFLSGADLHLADEAGDPIAETDDRAKRWADVQEQMGLGLKLKLVDRYTVLDRTCFLRIDHGPEGMRAQVYLPQNVDVAFDPAHPFDLDKAWGVRLRIGGEDPSPVVDSDGKPASKGRRFEFWCARPGCEQYRVIWDDGTCEAVDGNAEGVNPYKDEAGAAIVPLVMFTLHADELGAFSDAEGGLHRFNKAMDVEITDANYIATCQGFGQLVISYAAGLDPAKQQEMAIGPTRALELKDGAQATMLSPHGQISSLIEKIDRAVKRQANLHGIPPGAVSLEGRQVASGVALQIEMRPLMEARTDAVGFYRVPMRRVWRVTRIVHDARSEGFSFGPTLQARWQPSDIQLPESEAEVIERLILLRGKGWISDVQAIAKLRRLSSADAKAALEEIRKENAELAAQVVAPEAEEGDPKVIDFGAARAKLEGEPEAVEAPEPAALEGTKAAEVQAQAVDPKTALNGAQVEALMAVVQAVAEGQLPRATGIEIIVAAFPVSREDAERIMGEVGKTFEPKAPEAQQAPPPFTPE